MKTAIKLAILGFVAGVMAALVLAMENTPYVIPHTELAIFWPVSLLGIDITGWADGNTWHFLEFLFLFVGNGLVYAVVAGCIGAFVEWLQGIRRF